MHLIGAYFDVVQLSSVLSSDVRLFIFEALLWLFFGSGRWKLARGVDCLALALVAFTCMHACTGMHAQLVMMYHFVVREG